MQPVHDFQSGRKMLSEGKLEQGLDKLERASNADPQNVEYRQYLFTQREAAVNRLLQLGDAARAQRAFDAAAGYYRRVLAIDKNNDMAKQGLSGIEDDKRRQKELAAAQALFDKGDLDGAHDRLRAILSEDPLQQEAIALQKRIDEKRAENREAAPPALKLALKKTISLEFHDADIRSVFDVISRVSGLNFIFDKDIQPGLKVTIFVKNTTIEEAVRLVLVTNKLNKEVLDDNTLLIYPDTPQKNHDYQQQVVKSFYLANADAQKTLEMLRTILKVKDVFVDDKTNMLVLRDTPDVVRLAEKLIAADDLPVPEVELDLEVLEISSDRLANLGLQFPQQISASLGNAGTYTLSDWKNRNSGFVTLKITDPALALNLQKTDSDATLLANPRIRVKSREKAKIHIGQRLPVLTTIATANVGTSESVNYIDVGLKLDVEPSIRLDDQVDMKVNLEVSSVDQTITLTSGTQVYKLGTRDAETSLRLRDGETQVLAGLIQNNETAAINKVPGLGDIPLLGRLFSNDNRDKTKTELVLLITPHIVRDVERPDSIYSEFPVGTESNVGEPLRSVAAAAAAAAGNDAAPAAVRRHAAIQPPAEIAANPAAKPVPAAAPTTGMNGLKLDTAVGSGALP